MRNVPIRWFVGMTVAIPCVTQKVIGLSRNLPWLNEVKEGFMVACFWIVLIGFFTYCFTPDDIFGVNDEKTHPD